MCMMGGGRGRGSVVIQPEKERITELEDMCTQRNVFLVTSVVIGDQF
jgi:hypothetical protein